MKLQFAHNQYLMSQKFSQYPTLGKVFNYLMGTTNIGQFARANIFKKLIKSLPHHSFEEVFDLGCGQGEYAFMMAGAIKHARILALDVEPKRIVSINKIVNKQQIPNLETHLGPIESLSENERFDFIYSVDVFEHILEENMPFSEAFCRLKQGGLFLVKMPSKIQKTVLPSGWFKQHQSWLDDEHIGQVYMLDDLKERMKKEGFHILYASYSDGLISRLSWELGYLSKKVGRMAQICLLPFLKGLILLDRIVFRHQSGNSIQVIGKKI